MRIFRQPRVVAWLLLGVWIASVLAVASFLPIWSRYKYRWVFVDGGKETVESKGGITLKYAPAELVKESSNRAFWDDATDKWDYYRNNNRLAMILTGSLISLWPLSALLPRTRWRRNVKL